MTVTAEISSQLLDRAFAEAQPVLAPWIGDALLRANLAMEIASDLDRAESEQSQPSGTRLVSLPGGRWATVYIAQGADVEMTPKTLVRFRNFAIENEVDAARLNDEVRSAVAPHEPPGVLVFAHGKPRSDLSVYTHYVAALMDRLTPSDRSVLELQIDVPSSLDYGSNFVCFDLHGNSNDSGCY